MAHPDVDSTVRTLISPHLERKVGDDRPIVLMTCGMAGAGKTTLVKSILAAHPTFHRLSIDFIIHQHHGIYGIDYAPSSGLYAQYNDEADKIYEANFRDLLAKKHDVVLERSFYAKEDRDEFRGIAEQFGARVVLVFLEAKGERGKEVLWERIRRRSQGVKTADSALDIDRETFEGYWKGFEDPVGEGEIVVEVLS